jgi:biopolymer transport protein TolQ
MVIDSSIIGYFYHASPVVKIVMLLLLAASFTSWIIIFQRGFSLRRSRKHLNDFENQFWSTSDLTQMYQTIDEKELPEGLEKIFLAGFKEFARLQKRAHVGPKAVMAGAQRFMRVEELRMIDELETHLPILATIGATSPYVGLFGTVWGIMTAFQALGHVSQATIAMVAPGISEALIATAMGLFAAIPAVIAYNRYSNLVERLLNRNEAFQEEFAGYLYRQAQLLGSKK